MPRDHAYRTLHRARARVAFVIHFIDISVRVRNPFTFQKMRQIGFGDFFFLDPAHVDDAKKEVKMQILYKSHSKG